MYGSEGPAYTETTKKFRKDDPVAILHLSDLMALEWVSRCKDEKLKPDRLRYIIRNGINNMQTRNVVRKAVGGSLSGKLIEWPGYKFEPSKDPSKSDVLNAFLGTPNGVAIVHMLAQHKESLGTRQVANAVVWKVKPISKKQFLEKGPWLWMLFELNEIAPSSAEQTNPKGGPSKVKRADRHTSLSFSLAAGQIWWYVAAATRLHV